MELARPAVFLFSYFCRGRESSNEASRPAVFLFSYFCGGRESSNGASCFKSGKILLHMKSSTSELGLRLCIELV